ncbi:GGDEF domain-containing response regulator [Leptolyngbya sp. BC1307]|uniref:putative bifunctional diguanylate cyclase/phosphodiesterase n=1 Tax=Leptolyngbya sp. BC1307 TaxID=2029589 RepID=UPI00198070E7|nr:GGDEF domain-containing response regulator [Leptolyngbya sp. BC1307]
MSDTFTIPADEVTGRILVVDDTATNLYILSKLLARSGYEVYQAQDGAAALDMASAHQPSLILLDIMMPGMDGYEVCTRLRAMPETAHIPIIFLSALDSSVDKVLAFSHGAADYVTKPFQPEEVLARVRHQINLQLAQRQQQYLNAELERRVQDRTHQLELAHQQLLEVAMSDRLTRLPNRLSFVKQLGNVMAQAQIEPEQHFAVLFLDCDRFKRINDSLGHRVGDQLLKEIASRLTRIQHSHSTVAIIARFGGDEFALLLTPLADRQAVVLVADEVLTALAKPFALADRKIFMSASLGIVWGDASYAAAEHLLRDADVAMYRAKDCSYSQYLWFEPAMHNRAVHLLQLETDLRLALERRELEIYYQPIVELCGLRIVGFEALVRWRHPTQGLVFPGHFISFAEESGLIVPLGEQVLEMTCADIARWERSGAISPEITVSVNMAAQQLLQPDIVARIHHFVETAGIAPHRLRLELTERSILNNHAFIDGVLRALQHRNIQLSIDDFGTGYSALSYLHTLPVDCLKIDRSFVQPMTARPDSLGIVPLIINIAKTMNMQVIAEGIETITQLRQLQQLGCEYGQGYLFQKAVPADVAIALLKRPLIAWTREASA